MTMALIFVLDVPEFRALVEAAREGARYQVREPRLGYWTIEGRPGLRFERKALGFKPAVWHGALTGGFVGRITRFDNDVLEIEDAS
jgi:hypothetical protein